MSANLILHWMLDDVVVNTVADETQNNLAGTVSGNPKIVADEKFGSCLQFDGVDDSITLADHEKLRLTNYTVEVWIKPIKNNTRWQGIIGKPGRNYNIWLNNNRSIQHCFHTKKKSWDCIGSTDTLINYDQWNHVAITNDGKIAYTYVNGTLAMQGTLGGQLVVDNNILIVGSDLDNANKQKYYKGCIAHIRIYDNPLTLDEIRRDMAHDESAAAAFVRSHPIGFELYNKDNHHVLYIDDDPNGQTLNLDIANTSAQDIELKDLGKLASAENFHFALCFRPETLASDLKNIKLENTECWSLTYNHQSGPTGGDTLYLLRTGATTLKQGETLTLRLAGLNADGRAGTRGTRVELLAQNLSFAGDQTLLQDTRLQYLNIVNHRGRRNIPLHVGFVGGDTVLSDGKTRNTLRLRIANTSRDVPLRLSVGDAPSRFRITFDVEQVGETREWALVSQISGVTLKVTEPTAGWESKDMSKAQTLEWMVAPTADTELAANGHIDIELAGLVAPVSIGHANITINFENIPGYEDEQAIVVAQKSPVLLKNGNMGIGTNDPQGTLHIIHRQGDQKGNPINGVLILGPHDEANLRLGYETNYSWIQSHCNMPLAINPLGNNVGIGTKTPKVPLEVMQTTAKGLVTGLQFSAQHKPDVTAGGVINSCDIGGTCQRALTLQSNGQNVGIGITNPTQAKLVVSGGSSHDVPELFPRGYAYYRHGAPLFANYNPPQGADMGSYSIYADERIAASEFNAFSDARIKTIQGRSDSAVDLETLLGIEITDYSYKDVIAKGNALHKKVVAQQVEQVFPQAVSKITDVVPDIYQPASFIDGWVILATDLKKGERVRLIAEKTEGVYEVLEVMPDKFRTDFIPEDDKVFVFGREVNDFGNVDYDAIAMLNVSATQQLKKEIDALKAENAEIKALLNALLQPK